MRGEENLLYRRFDHLPEGLLETEADGLADLLGGPALIHLPGRRERPLFVSVLLHGNEWTGYDALRHLLRRYDGGRDLPRALSIFIGNVSAARRRLRRLEGQPDYNRVWPGGEAPEGPEGRMTAAVVEEMAARRVFASIDIHNNTGLNPHYACVNRLDDRFFHLARLFSRTVVYFTRPRGVQSMAFARLCPAVTVECGQSGQPHGEAHAMEFVEAALHLSEHPLHAVPEHDIDLYHTVAAVRVPDGLRFGFGDCDADLCFEPDLDRLNFRELRPGTLIGRLLHGDRLPLIVQDNEGREVRDDYFVLEEGEILTARSLMPSMLTLDERVIRQDCLGYLMERYPIHLSRAPFVG